MLFDQFLTTNQQNAQLNQTQLRLLGVTCISLSAKYEEVQLPRIQDFVALVSECAMSKYSLCDNFFAAAPHLQKRGQPPPAFSEEQLKNAEVMVLGSLDWSLSFATVIEYVQLFLSQGVLFSSDRVISAFNPCCLAELQQQSPIEERLADQIEKYAEFFADLCLQDFSFYSHSSLTVACGIISAARFYVGIEDVWAPELEELTETPFAKILAVLESVLEFYEQSFPQHKLGRRSKSCLRRKASPVFHFPRSSCEKENRPPNTQHDPEMLVTPDKLPLPKPQAKVNNFVLDSAPLPEDAIRRSFCPGTYAPSFEESHPDEHSTVYARSSFLEQPNKTSRVYPAHTLFYGESFAERQPQFNDYVAAAPQRQVVRRGLVSMDCDGKRNSSSQRSTSTG